MTVGPLLGLMGGAAVGALYFGGLWLTLRRIISTQHPLVLAAVSFIVRAAAALAIFYLIMKSGWQPLVAAMVGFLIVRMAVTRLLGPETSTLTEHA